MLIRRGTHKYTVDATTLENYKLWMPYSRARTFFSHTQNAGNTRLGFLDDITRAHADRIALMTGTPLENNLEEFKHTFYEESVKVPTIMSWPGVLPEGKQHGDPAGDQENQVDQQGETIQGQGPGKGGSGVVPEGQGGEKCQNGPEQGQLPQEPGGFPPAGAEQQDPEPRRDEQEHRGEGNQREFRWRNQDSISERLASIMHQSPTATADPAVPPGVLVPRTLDVLSSTPRVLGPAVAR